MLTSTCKRTPCAASGARMQSTLITYKGAVETSRSVGDTDPASIASQLDKVDLSRVDESLAASGLAFLAGLLSVLSPCVLPLVPIVLGSAASRTQARPGGAGGGRHLVLRRDRIVRRDHRFLLGLDGDRFRTASAVHDDRGRNCSGDARAAGAPRARRRADQPLGRFPHQRSRLARVVGAIRHRPSARAPCGAPAPGRRWARPRFWPPRAARSARSR